MPVSLPSQEELRDSPERLQLRTVPYDPRFPNTNQTRNCWQKYVDWRLCLAGASDAPRPESAEGGAEKDAQPLDAQKRCKGFLNAARILCPESWIEAWDEQMEQGRFPADIPKPKDDA